MASPSTCENCGATSTTPGARHCTFCGTALPALAVTGPPSLAERFAAVRAHETLGALMRHKPSSAGHIFGAACAVGFFVVFVGIALVMLGATQTIGGAARFIGLFPLLFVAVGIGMLVVILRRTSRFISADLERVVARVVDERTEISGGGRNSSASTTYYVTLEREDGTRHEHEANGRIAGLVTRDDVGIAYLRGDAMLDFRRVPV